MSSKQGSMFKFFNKIILPSFLAVILFVLTLFYIVIPVFENAMMDRKREMIQELTNSASSILEKYHKDEVEGLISKEEAQQTAISRIQYLRYGDENKDYFWITDMHPIMIMHPYVPELNGTDLSDYEDSHGKKMFMEFVKTVKEHDHGFVEYMWQWKDDSTHVVPKLSYVSAFKPWGWIIGTGIYIEDVRKEISALSSKLMYISIIIAFITALILTFISFQSLHIERKRQLAESNLKESREKYRSLVEASTEGLVMISDNMIIFANQVFQNLSGLHFSEIESMNWQKIFNLPEQLTKNISLGIYDIETEPFETEITLPDHRKIHVLIHLTPILFYGKKAVIFSIKDISSDLLIKRELSESRERFKTLMDKLNVGIFRTTLDSRGRFMEANDTAITLLGFKAHEQLRDKYILDLFAEPDDKRNFRKKLIETGFIRNQVIKLINSEGSTTDMMVSLAVISDESGNAAWCDGIIEPLPERSTNNQSTIQSMDIDDLRAILQSISLSELSVPIHQIRHDVQFDIIADLISAHEDKYLLVTDSDNLYLGYITEKEIISSIASENKLHATKAYNIMKSPLPVISRSATTVHARRLMKKTGADVLLVTDANGAPSGMISDSELKKLHDTRIIEFLESFENSVNVEQLTILRKEFEVFISKLIVNNIHSKIILQLLSAAFDSISGQLFQIAFRELGQPPQEFAFLVLGSEGRQEQTLKTDQDNAIIYKDDSDENSEAYFLNLGKWICQAYDTIGYPFCKGEIMAMNPKWNQPLSNWKQYFSNWINTGHARDLLEINIFFDFRLCYGSQQLTDELQKHITTISEKNPAYLHLMARNTIQSKLTVSDITNLKESIAAVVNFLRIYSLQHGIENKNTLFRLMMLKHANIMKDSSAAEIEKAFEFLTELRLKHQALLILDGKNADNNIEVKQLTDFEQSVLKKAFTTIGTALTKLNYDFRLNI